LPVAVLFVLIISFLADPSAVMGDEVRLSSREFERLDTFEAHTLSKADTVFAAKDYKRASAEYDSFLLEFPKSKAVAYALLRKARCLHLDEKRFEAIKEYTEVLDYFPNAVKYAAAALYYIGLCYWENGDEEKAMREWAKMAEDEDYSKHVLAAWAINGLADHMAKSGGPEKAVEYHKQVAIDFRRSNADAARYAIDKVIPHYIRSKPDEPKLREFYQKVGTFDRDPHKAKEELAKSWRYWATLRHHVHRNGHFTEEQTDLRDRYYRYWVGQMDGHFAEWDDFQIDVAHFKRAYERDVAKWMKRLDDQFSRYQKPGDYARIVKWISVYRGHKSKVMQYYNKLTFGKMTNRQIIDLMRIFLDQKLDAKMARSIFAKIRLNEMSDKEKTDLAHYLWHKEGSLVKDVCMSMDDKEYGHAELLRFYHWARDAKNGVPLADKVVGFPTYAQEALFKKAQLLHWTKKYKEAIAAYQRADNPPENLWGIATCYAKMGKLPQAVQQLREVEAFFKDHAPEAALRIANLYRDAGQKKLRIASLRSVLKKYPESGQSSEAHQQLERLGIKIGGGVDAQ
jgi:tetratricopeptide (TPR) repeat protein